MATLLNPFSIHIDPMERLLLVNFEKDPDDFYIGFEPQVFDDAINGKGHLIIGWRVDGQVDVYHQASLILDHSKYDIAGKGLANMISADMQSAKFDINEFGVQAHYQFNDIHNRAVEIKIHESNTTKRKPFGLLAPMGDAAENPSAMPLVLLHDFYFVRKNETEILISINGKSHRPDRLPIPMDWTKMYFSRYSPKPVIATLNPAYDGVLSELKIENGKEQVEKGDCTYEVEWRGDVPNLKTIIKNNNIHPIQMSFNPAFPNLGKLEENIPVKGNFEIKGHPSIGAIGGDYLVIPKQDNVFIVLVPAKGWKPQPTKFSLRFLYTVGKIFKKWPTTYRWEAKIGKIRDAEWSMKSSWKRTGKIQ